MNEPMCQSEEHSYLPHPRLRYLSLGTRAVTFTATRHVYNKEDKKQILGDA